MKSILRIISFVCVLAVAVSVAEAEDQEITVFISGQSHATLYPCSCPISPTGGVARRATVIREARASGEHVIAFESGASFAGGSFDSASQSTALDQKRTNFYLDSLAAMKYDAVLVSSEELNYGVDFLRRTMKTHPSLTYLSANLGDAFQPYLIRTFGDIVVGIIGITDEGAAEEKNLSFRAPQERLQDVVEIVRTKEKADVVIVLTYLEEERAKELLSAVDGIDILVAGQDPFRTGQTQQINTTTLIMPAWESRSIYKVVLGFSPSEPVHIETSEISLTKDVVDDPAVSQIIPTCFDNLDCAKKGSVATCKNGGTLKATCEYEEMQPVAVTVIKPSVCFTCDIDTALSRIKNVTHNVNTVILTEDDPQAQALIKQYSFQSLPVYFIRKDADMLDEVRAHLSKIADLRDDIYVVKPEVAGISYFLNRERIPNRIDVFFDIATQNIVDILEVLREVESRNKAVDVRVHFLAIKDPTAGIIAKAGIYEVEEYLRSACVGKYYPDKLWDYLICRLSRIESSWWDDCLIEFDIDINKIKTCAQSDEGMSLIPSYISLSQELEVVFGPTFLIHNQEIFGTNGIPTVEEIEKLLIKD